MLVICTISLIQQRECEYMRLMRFIDSNEFHPLILTAYNSHVNQTDNTPHITASGRRTSFQTLALSRDFIFKYNHPDNAGFNYGDTVDVFLHKTMIVEDTMNPRYTKHGDIWTKSKAEAKRFSRREGLLIRRKR